jgi:hypothetical protein
MKNNIWITTGLLTVIITLSVSCRKNILNEAPYGVQTDVSFFKTSNDLNNALTAAYSFIKAGAYTSSIEVQGMCFGDIGSDDALKGGNDSGNPDMVSISLTRQNSSNSWVSGYYTNLYAGIAACNLITDKASVVTGDPATIAQIVNQAKFLRAYFYYQLVTEYGAVPMPLTYLDPSAVTLSRSPATAIWAQIESDLTAATTLPTKSAWGAAMDGHITSGAAYALLGKAYMFEKKYPQAETAFAAVVAQNQYSLLADYGANWRVATGDNNNSESVFDIKHKNNVPGQGSWLFTFQSSDDPQDGGFAYNQPIGDFMNEFEPGDPRIIYTVVFQGDVFPTLTSATWTVVNALEIPYHTLSRKGLIPPAQKAGGLFDEARSVHVIRYSEVLLLFAEALNENGKSAQALPFLNMVRARARTTPASDPERISCSHSLAYTGQLLPDVTATNQSDLRTAIWHEERVELGQEMHRREYLLRTGRFEARMQAAKGAFGVGVVDPHYNLLPIPLTEINLANGKLTQNPGY